MAAHPENPPDGGTPSKGTTIDDLSSRFMAVAATAGAKTMQHFLIKLQYKPPATAETGDTRVHLSTAAKTFLSKVKLTHVDDVSFVSLADDTLIDLQSMPTKTDAEQMFKDTGLDRLSGPSQFVLILPSYDLLPRLYQSAYETC
jgi:hypothetical protein